MKRFKTQKAYLAFMTILTVFMVLPGCGGEAGGGRWAKPISTNPVDAAAPPTVTAVAPVSGAPAVSVSTKIITASFSKAMVPGTLTTTSFTLFCNGTQITGGGPVTYASSGNLATLPLPASTNLAPLAACTATITTGATDLAGNALANDYVWNFTTGAADTTLPKVLRTVPATTIPGPTVAVSNTAIKATFNENMAPASITAPGAMTVTGPGIVPVDGALIPVTYNVGTRTATFIPLNPLTDGVTYTVTIKGIGAGAATDVAINALAGNPALPLVANDYVWSFTTAAAAGVHLGPAKVVLGATEPYGVLSNIGITLGGGPASTTGFRVDGDVGISMASGAGGACVGCDSTTVTGIIANGTVPAAAAMTALEAAYNDAMGRTTGVCTLVDSGILTTNPSIACGGNSDGIFVPGLYWTGSSMAIPAGGTITLDAQNDPTAVFIFQADSTINSIGGNTHIILKNQAQAKNVYWVTKTSSTIGGTNSDFAGTILALVGVTVNTGTVMEGRALARGAEVTVQDGALIVVPDP